MCQSPWRLRFIFCVAHSELCFLHTISYVWTILAFPSHYIIFLKYGPSLYLHLVRFVVLSSVLQNPICGRSTSGAEGQIRIPSIYLVLVLEIRIWRGEKSDRAKLNDILRKHCY